MKLDDGNLMLASMIKLFKVFLHFQSSDASEYRKCMLVNLLLWAHYSVKRLPIFEMVSNNANVCNEEAGELAFSILARTISSNSSRMDIDAVNRHFILSRLKLDVAKDLNLDISDSETVLINNHFTIKRDSAEVEAVGVHFKTIVTNLKHNYFHHYKTTPVDAMFSCKNQVEAQRHMVSSKDEDVKEWFLINSRPVIEELIVKTKKALAGEWLVNCAHLWPEAKRMDPFDEEGWEDDPSPIHQSLSVDENSDEKQEAKQADSNSHCQMPESKQARRRQTQIRGRKRKGQQAVCSDEESYHQGESQPNDMKMPQPSDVNAQQPARKRYSRSAKPRHRLDDLGSEADDVFMQEAGLEDFPSDDSSCD